MLKVTVCNYRKTSFDNIKTIGTSLSVCDFEGKCCG